MISKSKFYRKPRVPKCGLIRKINTVNEKGKGKVTKVFCPPSDQRNLDGVNLKSGVVSHWASGDRSIDLDANYRHINAKVNALYHWHRIHLTQRLDGFD